MHYLDQAIVDVAFVPDNFLVDMSPYVLMMFNVNMSRYRVLGPKVSLYCTSASLIQTTDIYACSKKNGKGRGD